MTEPSTRPGPPIQSALVIEAGPAGLSAAVSLRRAGVGTVHVIEAQDRQGVPWAELWSPRRCSAPWTESAWRGVSPPPGSPSPRLRDVRPGRHRARQHSLSPGRRARSARHDRARARDAAHHPVGGGRAGRRRALAGAPCHRVRQPPRPRDRHLLRRWGDQPVRPRRGGRRCAALRCAPPCSPARWCRNTPGRLRGGPAFPAARPPCSPSSMPPIVKRGSSRSRTPIPTFSSLSTSPIPDGRTGRNSRSCCVRLWPNSEAPSPRSGKTSPIRA